MSVMAGYKLNNLLHSVLLLGAMALVLAALGWSWWGSQGLVWLALAPRASPRMILRSYRARSLSPDEAPGLFRILVRLADRARLSSVPRLYYVSSRVMNAFSLGRREEAAIALSHGLLRRCSARPGDFDHTGEPSNCPQVYPCTPPGAWR